MPSNKDHWEHIYRTADHHKVGWYQDYPHSSLRLLSRIRAHPQQSVIDVGCGASLLVDHLIQQGYSQITLLDLSAHALASVKSRLGAQGTIPTYLSQDICRARFKQRFDIWHDRAVFHFLTQASDRHNYLSVLQNSLSASGHAIIGTFALDGPDSCSGLDVVQYDDEKISSELPHGLQLIYSEPSVHIMPSGTEQQYRYFLIGND